MSLIKPFRVVHPAEGLWSRVAALPYDVYNRAEARAEARKEPLSFLNIDRPETQFEEGHDMYAPEVYRKAADLYRSELRDGVFIQEKEPCFCLYELTMGDRSQTGLVCCASVDEYLSGAVKKHENTRAEKETDRIRHVTALNAQTGPIFLAFRSRGEIIQLFTEVKRESPAFDFISEDGIRHRGWIVPARLTETFEDAFQSVPALYIADGHHRAASAVKAALEMRRKHPDCSGEEPFNFFLSVLFPDEELKIFDYNRVVKDLNGLSAEQFLDSVQEKCDLLQESVTPLTPPEKGTFSLYLGDSWRLFRFHGNILSSDPVAGLDVSVLQNEILAPVLAIRDPRTDERIDFVGGIRGFSELERRVHADCAAAFRMYPTSIAELFSVADAGRLMPPKSTWFEPKLRSGLFIHEM